MYSITFFKFTRCQFRNIFKLSGPMLNTRVLYIRLWNTEGGDLHFALEDSGHKGFI